MIIPLEWLSEYVKIPKDLSVLTDKLTAIGHMLDKTKEVNGHAVIDLELRGNRSDMFGVYGVARETSAALKTPLKPLQTTLLGKKDPSCPLVVVEKNATDLVTRFLAIKLKVKVAPSPNWLIKRLEALDIPSINNVVDVTNYVMMETAEPMHAFDLKKIVGEKLILRQAKKGERFSTIQQGLEVVLNDDDLVICDAKNPQSLTAIGGLNSKVTDETSEIILEAAVYNAANSRRSSRRLKIFTNGSVRHEKHLDPNQVETALERAVCLLKEVAEAQVVGGVSDYYPNIIKPKIISFDLSEIYRLAGINIELKDASSILESLGFKVTGAENSLKVTIPTFRTDIDEPADIVEEVVRMYGYENIPSLPISDAMPAPQTYESYAIQEKLRDHMTGMGFDEAITLTMVPNDWAPDGIKLVNPPDPDRAMLRTSIIPSLQNYAQRLLNFNVQRVSIFEIGKVFAKSGNGYSEKIKLCIAAAGLTNIKQWNSQPQQMDIYYLTGVIQALEKLTGVGEIKNVNYVHQNNIYVAEIDVTELLKNTPKFINPYRIVSQFAPLVEDYNIVLEGISYQKLKLAIENVSSLISSVRLIDKHGDKLTIRVVYHADSKQLSGADISPLREKIMALGKE